MRSAEARRRTYPDAMNDAGMSQQSREGVHFRSRDKRRRDEISRGAKSCFSGRDEGCRDDVSRVAKACFSGLGYRRGICLVLGLFDYVEKIIQLVVGVLPGILDSLSAPHFR